MVSVSLLICIAVVLSDSGGIQTHDLQNRNLTLYSAKLPSLVLSPQRYGKKRLDISCWLEARVALALRSL